MTVGSTQPLTEMSTRNHLRGEEPSASIADNFTALWVPRRLTTLWAAAACYRDVVALLVHTQLTAEGIFDNFMTNTDLEQDVSI
jgi:hypothetical protein